MQTNFGLCKNRVIFITNNSLEALERVSNRRINIYTGEYKHKDEIAEMEDVVAREQFVIHPDDELTKVMKEQKEFDDNIQVCRQPESEYLTLMNIIMF